MALPGNSSLHERAIVHVDMDAFFASVEQRDNEALQGQPVLVGRIHRGVVCAASYEARVFGCRSAMPMSEALRRCPQAIVVAPRFAAYQTASRAVFAIFAQFTPLIEPLSLDEAFLDVTGSIGLFGPAKEQAANIRAQVAKEVGLPCSAGVAPCKFVAKLASVWAKPNGLAVVAADEVESRLAPLDVAQMYGVGTKMASKLKGLGLVTFAHLRAACPATLANCIGEQEALRLVALAWGRDDRPVVAGRTAKSVGSEETLHRDCTVPAELLPLLLRQALQVASQLAAKGLYARGLRLKLKSTNFVLQTRQTTLAKPTCQPDPLYEAATRLLEQAALPKGGVRLAGLAAFALSERGPEASLFVDPKDSRGAAIEAARLAIEQRFGRGQLTRAAVLAWRSPSVALHANAPPGDPAGDASS